MSHEKDMSPSWLKGNLPTWIATGLLAIVTFFIVKETNRLERLDMGDRDKGTRIAVLEEQTKEIKKGQDAVLIELKEMNRVLRMRQQPPSSR